MRTEDTGGSAIAEGSEDVVSMKELSDIFIDKDERESLILGEWYLHKFLKGDAMKGRFCVLTDKRLYFNGRYFQKSGRSYRPDKGEYAIDLMDVTGSGFTTARLGIVLFLEILFVIVLSLLTALFLVAVDAVEHYHFSRESIVQSCLVLLVLGLVAAPIYFYLKPLRIFVVEYGNSGIAFLTFDYLDDEARLLQKALHKAKDALVLTLHQGGRKVEACAAEGTAQEQEERDFKEISEEN